MAAVIGDFIAGPSRFHNMIASPSIQHQHAHSHTHTHSRDDSSPARYRSLSTSRHDTTPRQQRPDPAAEYTPASPPPTTTASSSASSPAPPPAAATVAARSPAGQAETPVSGAGASRFPSPPPSSSPSVSTGPVAPHDAKGASTPMEAPIRDAVSPGHPSSSGPAAPQPAPRQQQPSPPSDDFPISDPSYLASDATPTQGPQQTVIHVRDLEHVQSLAKADMLAGNGSGMLNDPPLQQMKYEISAMPIGDIIEMVAALLTKITTTNDLQHDAMSRNVTHQQQANQTNETSGSSTMSPLSHSVLAFHGKNVPAITILSYLSRIHKYCPTTYEVFLSLLVYFDRMTERVNEMVTKGEEARRQAEAQPTPQPPSTFSSAAQPPVEQDTTMVDGADLADSDESDSDLADDDDDDMAESPAESANRRESGKIITAQDDHHAISGPATYFVVDSFNIHRLIIAGVTCASKFFSDVFYTNSRYAKVGGLPLAELNHLELQFLVLNDFRLAVPVEDLEAYATMLVEFYAREVVAQRPAAE